MISILFNSANFYLVLAKGKDQLIITPDFPKLIPDSQPYFKTTREFIFSSLYFRPLLQLYFGKQTLRQDIL